MHKLSGALTRVRFVCSHVCVPTVPAACLRVALLVRSSVSHPLLPGKSAGALEPVAAPVSNPISLAAPVATPAAHEAALIAITPAAPSAAPIVVTPAPVAPPAAAPAAPAPAAPAAPAVTPVPPAAAATPAAPVSPVTIPPKVAVYVAHGRNPKQQVSWAAFKKRRAEWLKRKAEKEKLAGAKPAAAAAPTAAAPGAPVPAAPAVAAPRFMQLPSAAHDAELLRTLDAVLSHSASPAAGSITDAEHDSISYNADSPLSSSEKRSLEQAHAQVSVKGALLHDQETLDRAQIVLDDATKQKAELLAQYPAADSLLQFSSHN